MMRRKVKVKKEHFLAVASYMVEEIEKLVTQSVDGVRPCEKTNASCLLCKNFRSCILKTFEETSDDEEEFDAYERG